MNKEETQPPVPNSPTEPAALVAAFDRQLVRRGRAAGTRVRYGRVVRGFLASLDSREAGALAAAEIERYLERWQERFHERYGRPAALASYRGQVNALRSFYGYLERQGLLAGADGRRCRIRCG